MGLLRNPQDLGFPLPTVHENCSEAEKALPDILFHVTSVLRCIDFDELLNPLREIFLAPRQMLVSGYSCQFLNWL